MKLQTFEMEKGDGKRIPSPGCCIYCGAKDVKLTDEHVVPYALGGNTAVFEKACCITCQRVIQPYEQRILRGQLGAFRSRIDAPTRNPKDRPTTTELRFIEVDGNGNPLRHLCTKSVPVQDAPLSFGVWDLAPPRILGEGTTEAQHMGQPWAYYHGEVSMRWLDVVRGETGCTGHVAVKLTTVNREDFLRFIAKTAHAFAVAELGVDSFLPLVADLILCRDNDLAEYVGGDPSPSLKDSNPANMSELTVGTVKTEPAGGYTAVRIRLYPLLGTPAHVVIVGAPA